MIRFLRIHMPFARAGIQVALAYKLNFIGFVMGDILRCFILFFLWHAVYAVGGGGAINGFSATDMVAYIFLAFLTTYLTFSDAAWALGDEIKDGSISMRIIKPIDFERPLLFQEMGDKSISVSLVTIPTLAGIEIYRFLDTGIFQFSLTRLMIFFISVFIGYFLSFYFNLCFGFLVFLAKNVWGLQQAKGAIVDFISGSLVPIAFMPDVIGKVLTILPFASLTYTPVMIYLGKYDFKQTLFAFGLQIFWFAFFYFLSKVIWHFVIKHLCVQGG